MFLSLFCSYFVLDIPTGVVYTAFFAVMGFLCKTAYERNGCLKRIEQGLKDLKEQFDNHIAKYNK